jgi:hypothetical protein
MSYQTSLIEEIVEIGAEIKNLRLELAPLKERMALIECRLEGEMSRLTALVSAGRSEAAAAVEAVPEVPSKRRKRPFAGSGTIKDVLDHMKAHPAQEVSPESIAVALGQPEKNGLMATCLKRLCEAGLVHRPRTGHYAYLQQVEATMT